MVLENKVVQILKLSKNDFNKKFAPKLLFFIIGKDSDDSYNRKFTLKVRFWHFFLTNCPWMDSQSTVVSFEYVEC